MLDKIDLNNSRTLTILVIVVLILFAIIYVCVINQNNIEGFAESVLEAGDTVRLKNGLTSVVIGATGTTNVSDLINSRIQEQLKPVVPPLSIVSFYGSIAPTGWQLCDGSDLLAMDTKIVYDSSGTIIKTPNLQGRTIVGTNTSSGAKPDGSKPLSLYNIGDYGGEEKHTLTIQEMPSHTHIINNNSIPCAGTSCALNKVGSGARIDSNIGSYSYSGPMGLSSQIVLNTGGDAAHYNMQPYYVLSYIIKKPSLGGLENPLSTVLPTNAPNVDKPKI